MTYAAAELLVIDSRVADYPQLLEGVASDVEVLLLQANDDAISKITNTIAKLPELKALHIVSHGAPGCLYIGQQSLELNNLLSHRKEIKTWSVPEILLYGCNVALGDAGSEFVEQLAELTQAKVAASTSPIGSAALGGNWELDQQLGQVESSAVFAPEMQQQYSYILADYWVQTNEDEVSDNGLLSLREAVLAVNQNGDINNRIFLQGGQTYSLSSTGIDDDFSGDLDLRHSGNLTIQSVGSSRALIDGNGADRILEIFTSEAFEGDNITNLAGIEIIGVGSLEALKFSTGGRVESDNRTTTLNIQDSHFSGRVGTDSRKASFISASSLDNLWIDNTDFIGDLSPSNRGKGIEIIQLDGNLTVSDSEFLNNSNAIDISSVKGDVNVSNSNFQNNQSNNNDTAGIDAFAVDGDFTVLGSSFQDNFGERSTGAISISNLGGSFTLTDSLMEGNRSAGLSGTGGVDLFDVEGNITISNSTFENNIGESGAGAIDVFNFRGNLTLADSIFDGNRSNGPNAGGIEVGTIEGEGNVTIANTVFQNNQSERGDGAIDVSSIGGNFNISSSVFEDNQSNGSGVGAANIGFVSGNSTISESSFTNNQSENGDGAVSLFLVEGVTNISDSIIANNRSNGFGVGGIDVFIGEGSEGDFSIADSTISNNFSDGRIDGVNIFLGEGVNDGDISISNSTIVASSNDDETVRISSVNAVDLIPRISNSTFVGDLSAPFLPGATISSSIFFNPNPNALGWNLSGVTSSGNNLINVANNTTPFLNGSSDGDIVGTIENPINPMLGPLQDNGGPTPTMALLFGSPAVNAGSISNANILSTDQRGEARIQQGQADIGAYESPFQRPPEVEVLGNNIPILDGDLQVRVEDGTAIGVINPGETLNQTFTVRNLGELPLVLSNLRLSQLVGDFPVNFSLIEGFDRTVLQENETTTFTVQLIAASEDEFNDGFTLAATTETVLFNTNDPDESLFDFVVGGGAVPGNARPLLETPITDQVVQNDLTGAYTVNFTIPSDTFSDPDGDILTYTATLDDGSPLPSWLSLNENSGTFSGISSDITPLSVQVTATDPSGETVTDEFDFSFTTSFIGTSGRDTIIATEGVDFIQGLGNKDNIQGLGGNDIIEGGGGIDTIEGGDGDDLIFGGENSDADTDKSNDIIFGGAGNDTLVGGNGKDQLFGGDGDDLLIGEFLSGQDGTLTVDILDGGAGNDTIIGGAGVDFITGGDGDDILIGGAGSDRMSGGAGADIYIYNAISEYNDIIADFDVTEDKIDMSAIFNNNPDYAVSDIFNTYLAFRQRGSRTEVRFDFDGDNGNRVFQTFAKLDNVDATTITADNFIF